MIPSNSRYSFRPIKKGISTPPPRMRARAMARLNRKGNEVSRNLRAALLFFGFTHRDMAIALGISRQHLYATLKNEKASTRVARHIKELIAAHRAFFGLKVDLTLTQFMDLVRITSGGRSE